MDLINTKHSNKSSEMFLQNLNLRHITRLLHEDIARYSVVSKASSAEAAQPRKLCIKGEPILNSYMNSLFTANVCLLTQNQF